MATPDDHLRLMLALVRRSFEDEPEDAYAFYGFHGQLEYYDAVGWDDGYSAERFTITRRDVWSDYGRGNFRPVITVTVSADAQPHPPSGRLPLVVPRLDEVASAPAVALDRTPDDYVGRLTARAMAEHGGQDLRRLSPQCLAFSIVYDDEPPWVSRHWRPRE